MTEISVKHLIDLTEEPNLTRAPIKALTFYISSDCTPGDQKFLEKAVLCLNRFEGECFIKIKHEETE